MEDENWLLAINIDDDEDDDVTSVGEDTQATQEIQSEEKSPPRQPTASNPESSNSNKQARKPKQTSTCRFVIAGCPYKAARGTRQMQKHVRSNFERHLSLVCKTVRDQDEQMSEQRKKIDQQNDTILQLSQKIKGLTVQLDEVKKKQNNDETTQETLHDDLKKVKVNIRDQELSFTACMKDINERVEQFLFAHPITEDTKDNNRYGEHLWTIHNFSRRLKRIQSGKSEDPIRSEPFYTGLPGYKLCIWVYLNGRGKSLGRAMSVYAKVMMGEFDAILTWPIRPQFTFTVFEQNKGAERHDIVRTRRAPEIKRGEYVKGGIARPQADDRSIIVGFDDFVTHEELQSRGYLQNDNVFLKVEAELLD